MDRSAFDAMAEIENRHWWFVGRRAIIRALIADRIAPKRDARVLEVGCGTGGNLELLSEFGALDAMEYDDAARGIASARSGVPVKAGHLPDGLDQLGPHYDLIALLDVLEHIGPDRDALRALAARLAPGGRLFLTVPALTFLWSDHDVVHHHHRRYSRASLTNLLQQAGLTVDYVSYFNFFLLPAAIVQRLASRFARRAPPLDAMPAAPVNRWLTRIFAAERALLTRTRLPLGLSLCAICRAA